MKYCLLVIASMWVAACSAHDENYYRLHPIALQKAIEQCPSTEPSGVNCAQLKVIAVRINELAYQLRLNPQEYGKQILALQEKVAEQESHLQHDSNQANERSALAENKQRLQEYLAVVKWLESPES